MVIFVLFKSPLWRSVFALVGLLVPIIHTLTFLWLLSMCVWITPWLWQREPRKCEIISVVVYGDDETNIKWAFNVAIRLLCSYLEFITTNLVNLHYLG